MTTLSDNFVIVFIFFQHFFFFFAKSISKAWNCRFHFIGVHSRWNDLSRVGKETSMSIISSRFLFHSFYSRAAEILSDCFAIKWGEATAEHDSKQQKISLLPKYGFVSLLNFQKQNWLFLIFFLCSVGLWLLECPHTFLNLSNTVLVSYHALCTFRWMIKANLILIKGKTSLLIGIIPVRKWKAHSVLLSFLLTRALFQ